MARHSAKRTNSVIAIYVIILVLYVLAFVTIPFPKYASSWISFAFTILSIISSLLICGYAFRGNRAIDALYGFPIFRIGFIHMIVQAAAGIVMCICAAFISFPYWIALILSTLLFGIATISVILTENARDVAVEVEKSATESIKTLTTFNIDIIGIIDACEDENLKQQLQVLGDQIQYSSDPVSSEATKDIEHQIECELSSLKELVLAIDVEGAIKKTKLVNRLLNERNRICQANK